MSEFQVDRPGRWDKPFAENMTEADVARILAHKPFSEIDPDKFPKNIPLHGIIKNDMRIVRYRKGDIVVREGDYGNSAFYILKGRVTVFIGTQDEGVSEQIHGNHEVKKRTFFESFSQLWTNPQTPEYREKVRYESDSTGIRSEDGETRLFVQDIDTVLQKTGSTEIHSGEFFGEMAALGRMPRSTTIVAPEDDVELIEIKWQGLRDIRLYTPQIKEHIDRLYRERSLKTHLQETDIFKHLKEKELEVIADATEFHTYGKFDWHTSYKRLNERNAENRLDDEPIIVDQGDYANSLILIRSGFARLSERSGNGHRTIAYFGKGQFYGFCEIYHNFKNQTTHPYEYSLRAIGHVDVLAVPTKLIEKVVLPGLPESQRPWYALEKDPEQKGAETEGVDTLKQRDKRTRVSTDLLEFLVENRYINGTATMMIDMYRCTRCDDCVRACAASHGNNPRFIRQGKTIGNIMIGHACMHCQDPICMIGCPTGAIARNQETGSIVINDLSCIGCSTCAESCPYENIQMAEARDKNGAFLLDSQTNKPIVKATKCDLCFDQWGGPACERACPHDALVRIDMRDQPDLVKWLRR